MQHPERLGKYPITGVLGEGAMGVVYRAYDPDIRRMVALKTIRRQGGESAEAVAYTAARFRNEAQAAGRLQHPGIVGVYDFGDDGQVAYIAMEYVEGHTLAHYMGHRVRFSEADVASIATQTLDALAHAHENGVWHRDIKPSNLILTQGGRIKIADFGIARLEASNLTVANAVMGTPMFMAPEQFLGQGVDHRADIYAVGVVLYQLIAGRPPFVGTPEALMYQVVHQAPAPPSTVEGAMLGPRFDAVVAQALAKEAAARPAGAAVMRMAVAQALGQAMPVAVARESVFALPMALSDAPTERIVPLPTTGQPVAMTWDTAVLAQLEATLARHVGPLAAVMVRRASRSCSDLPTLQATLAEQITNPVAREAFLGRHTGGGVGSGGGRTTPPAPPPTTQGAAARQAALTEAQLEQAQRLLAAHVGPIARVVLKRALDRTRQREPLFALLAEAAPEAARARLLADLNRL
jgi:serine/threonine protein kinase